jgi:hypothetical protein
LAPGVTVVGVVVTVVPSNFSVTAVPGSKLIPATDTESPTAPVVGVSVMAGEVAPVTVNDFVADLDP